MPEDPRLRQVSCASLADAVGRRYGHVAHVLDLVSPTPDRHLFGRAIIMRFVPRRADVYDAERHNFTRLFYEAIGGDAPDGTGLVLVLSSSGHHDVSLGGGTKLSRIQNHGLAGVIADGRLRDFAQLATYTFASWCSGEALGWGGGTVMPYEVNVPVTLRSAAVFPGDYICADRSGAVIVPAAGLDRILDEAVGIENDDRRALETIRGERPEDVLRKGSEEM